MLDTGSEGETRQHQHRHVIADLIRNPEVRCATRVNKSKTTYRIPSPLMGEESKVRVMTRQPNRIIPSPLMGEESKVRVIARPSHHHRHTGFKAVSTGRGSTRQHNHIHLSLDGDLCKTCRHSRVGGPFIGTRTIRWQHLSAESRESRRDSSETHQTTGWGDNKTTPTNNPSPLMGEESEVRVMAIQNNHPARHTALKPE